MSIARVIEVSSTSRKSFEDAIQSGVKRVNKTMRGVKRAWVKEQHIRLNGKGKIDEFQVNLLVTFVLED